jgi:crotonobetainyl-CoA:carnitine CoA-transferase CaiB-like acyl-CoA transferase
MVVAANADNLWRRLCITIGRPELLEDRRFASHQSRGEHADELDEIIGAWVAEHDASEVDRLLNQAGVVCAPVYSIADVFADAHFRAREMLLDVEAPELGTLTMPGIVPKLSATPGGVRWAGSWELGSSNDDVYCDLLGLTRSELDQLREENVV